MTHYDTLGVGEAASPDEIKQAYRRLANQHHPDKGGDTNKFQQIQSAYEILSDEQRRAQYDAERRGAGGFRFSVNGHPFEQHFGGMEDIFSQFGFNPFGGDPFAHVRQPRKNKDLRIKILVKLEETLSTQNKTISVQTTNGERTTVHVQIPRGVTTGTTIKYAGLGDNLFNTLPRGDLYVQFEILGNQNFEVNGVDLMTNININTIEAIVGCTKNITGIDGKIFSVTIPQFTQNNSKLRIKDQGLYNMNSELRGNLIVNISLVTPTLGPNQLKIATDLLKMMG